MKYAVCFCAQSRDNESGLPHTAPYYEWRMNECPNCGRSLDGIELPEKFFDTMMAFFVEIREGADESEAGYDENWRKVDKCRDIIADYLKAQEAGHAAETEKS